MELKDRFILVHTHTHTQICISIHMCGVHKKKKNTENVYYKKIMHTLQKF